MTVTSYEVDKDLDESLQSVLDVPDLADAKEHIDVAICFKVREKVGDGDDATHEPLPPNGDVVVLKKIPPEMQCLMKGEPEYLVIVDKYFWSESDAKQKEISLYRMLIRLKVDTKSNGDFKFSIAPWDIMDSLKTLKRYGAYDEKWMVMAETLLTKRNQTNEMVEARLARAASAKAAPAAKAPAAKPKAAAKAAPKSRLDMPSDEDPPPEEEEEPPRVRMAQLPAKAKASPLKAEKNGEKDEPVRPARKPPADPEPESAPDPDDE